MKYLVFTINSIRFAVDIKNIMEIMIPGINGNISAEKMQTEKSILYQDKQVSIIPVSDLLLITPSKIRDDFKIIFCEIKGEVLGLLVDNADEIIRLPEEVAISKEKYRSEINADLIDGMFCEDEKEVYIVSPEKIFSLVKTI